MDKTYNPTQFEKRIYKRWLDGKCFEPRPNSKAKKVKKFSIVLPPPNITGQLHVGHGMNVTIPDAIVRFKRMKGYETLWLPGYDHASLATEMKVVEAMREEGLTKAEVGREKFLERAWAWKDKYGNRIVEQLKYLGVSLDFSRLAFTMDDARSRSVREVFVELYNQGYIYRGDRIINWCPGCKTAISDAEVDYETEASHLWHIKYPFKDGNGYVTVATTRPETLLGDTAVAVNPKDERYAGMEGRLVVLPLVGREIPIVYDDYVEKDFGTGAVKITPAHDPNDFEVGKRHNLEIIKVMNDDGTMNDMAGAYEGMPRSKAREAIVRDLQSQGLLEKIEDYTHNVGHCSRCDESIEPIVSKQWFVAMKELAKPAIDAVKSGKIKFIPKRFEKTYFNWMNNIRDWCISRQLWWGHRIPVFYCDGCGKEIASKTDITTCPHCGGKVRQDDDVLDTWFSSALWPFSTLGWPDDTEDLRRYYPTDLLVTAYDIIPLWVSRMIFSGIKFTGEVPFKEVYIHGLVRDGLGRKMSKSLGNGVDPIEVINTAGADALRFSLVNGIARGGDICFSNTSLNTYRNFMNKLYNAAKFVIGACESYGYAAKPVALTAADGWILGKLNALVGEVTRSMNRYDVGHAAESLYDFIWDEFCDWYIELSKVQFKNGDAKNTAGVLRSALETLLKLVHPIIPFITTEIYDNLPGSSGELMLSKFPTEKKSVNIACAKDIALTERLKECVRAVRNLKQTNSAVAKTPKVSCDGNDDMCALVSYYLPTLAKTEDVEHGALENAALIAHDGVKIFVALEDAGKERERLNKELEIAKSELKLAQSKLNNPGFCQKAPQKLVDAEKEKVKNYTERINALTEKLNNI
ncbi:MAG: valine--tRNA ligase [Clostridiales bacterium]|nr:valine--tRNA ligase [Clostridiales bacterium]